MSVWAQQYHSSTGNTDHAMAIPVAPPMLHVQVPVSQWLWTSVLCMICVSLGTEAQDVTGVALLCTTPHVRSGFSRSTVQMVHSACQFTCPEELSKPALLDREGTPQSLMSPTFSICQRQHRPLKLVQAQCMWSSTTSACTAATSPA
jgi:hypothetical protein